MVKQVLKLSSKSIRYKHMKTVNFVVVFFMLPNEAFHCGSVTLDSSLNGFSCS